ncbi:uncharacterized protein PAC_12146 [Phialocephala subalpina]|uniref:Uncharacterized protein n=1 Tax=Phialocephala subalpina TaxID=576137 RepID=A0A1L7XB54_9HELO|nr:uncharacterized protein PAC_12146 [Phialocephala subalpina]
MATRGRKGSASGGDGSLFFLTDGRLKTPNRYAWPTTSTPAAAVDQIKFNTHAADSHTAPQGGVLSGASRGRRAQSETDIWRDSLCFSYGGEKSSTDVIIILSNPAGLGAIEIVSTLGKDTRMHLVITGTSTKLANEQKRLHAVSEPTGTYTTSSPVQEPEAIEHTLMLEVFLLVHHPRTLSANRDSHSVTYQFIVGEKFRKSLQHPILSLRAAGGNFTRGAAANFLAWALRGNRIYSKFDAHVILKCLRIAIQAPEQPPQCPHQEKSLTWGTQNSPIWTVRRGPTI